jgi:hypothetical protein
MKSATKKEAINLPQILFELRFQRRAIYTTSHGIRIGERNLVSLISYILQNPTELQLNTLFSINQTQHPTRHCQTVQLQAVSCQDSVE